jgi:hypothetical protein
MTTVTSESNSIIGEIDTLLGNLQTPNTLTYQLYLMGGDPNEISTFLEEPQGQLFLKNMIQLESDLRQLELESDNPLYSSLQEDLESPISVPGLPPMSLINSIESEGSYEIAMRLSSINPMQLIADMMTFEQEFPPTAK